MNSFHLTQMTTDPIIFQPIYQQRVWGGRHIATSLGRCLPDDGLPYGESWEVVDRPEANSIVVDGRWVGKSLSKLWREHRQEIFGVSDGPDQFPILCKVLDARDKLSVQVHPPLSVCAQLNGEPKDEVWYLLEVEPKAELFAGLRRGATRDAFKIAIEHGGLANLLHVIYPSVGESIFITSGRLHAIGAGFLIFEIQQNSDTTYRVYDWDRAGLDGKPRDLHTPEALLSTNFEDFEPAMRPEGDGDLVRCPHFYVEQTTMKAGESRDLTAADGRFRLVAVASGSVTCGSKSFNRGDFFLVPVGGAPLLSETGAVLLISGLP